MFKIKNNVDTLVPKGERSMIEINLSYIAGFLEGDGCILSQIVRRKDYKYGFELRLSVSFYQKATRYWFILKIRRYLNSLGIRSNSGKKSDGMSYLTITGDNQVKKLLEMIYPYLLLKKRLARLTLDIINLKKTIKKEDDFIEVCKLIDKTSEYRDSKKKKITTLTVED